MIIQSLAHSTDYRQTERLGTAPSGGNSSCTSSVKHIFIEATETFGSIVAGTDMIMASVESNNIIDS